MQTFGDEHDYSYVTHLSTATRLVLQPPQQQSPISNSDSEPTYNPSSHLTTDSLTPFNRTTEQTRNQLSKK